MSAHGTDLFPALHETLDWARSLTAPGVDARPLPLAALAALRGVAPRTLRAHLARLEQLGLLERRYAGQCGISLHITAAAGECDGPGREAPRPLSQVTPERSDGRVDRPVDADRAGRAVEAANSDAKAAEAVALLTAAGVFPRVAAALGAKPWITPEIIAAWIHELGRVREVRNLAAVLVYRLQDPARCLPPPGAGTPDGPALGRVLGGRAARDHCADNERDGPGPATSGDVGAAKDVGAAQPVRPGARLRVLLSRAVPEGEPSSAEVVSPSEPLAALWERVRQAMAGRLGPDVDRVWLEHARPLSCADGVLILGIPTALGAEWLNLAGVPRCYEAIQEAAGRPLLLRFVPASARDCL